VDFADVIAANTTLPVMEKGTNPYRLPASLAVDPKATFIQDDLGDEMAKATIDVIRSNK
jgi:Mlc titration factor MtfA (ptsG expression regulator)